jgi:hypothetical protein
VTFNKKCALWNKDIKTWILAFVFTKCDFGAGSIPKDQFLYMSIWETNSLRRTGVESWLHSVVVLGSWTNVNILRLFSHL